MKNMKVENHDKNGCKVEYALQYQFLSVYIFLLLFYNRVVILIEYTCC